MVFSGGSAANSLVDVFNDVAEKKDCPLSYVIPISDNGGSSSEIIRVIGGPGIGDIRSKWEFPLRELCSLRVRMECCDGGYIWKRRYLEISWLQRGG